MTSQAATAQTMLHKPDTQRGSVFHQTASSIGGDVSPTPEVMVTLDPVANAETTCPPKQI